MNERTQKFLEQHRIRIIDQSKRAPRYRIPNMQYFRFEEDYNKVNSTFVELETEQLFVLEITDSELNRIADFESEVFNHMKQHGHYDMFNWIMDQKEREKYLKERYPAVKKAYEHYSLILKMAEAGEL